MQINSLAVFCGSKGGNNPLYVEQAKALGHLMASKKITLIYQPKMLFGEFNSLSRLFRDDQNKININT
jgi:hypothetical protein